MGFTYENIESTDITVTSPDITICDFRDSDSDTLQEELAMAQLHIPVSGYG